jgi:hypothetical protein
MALRSKQIWLVLVVLACTLAGLWIWLRSDENVASFDLGPKEKTVASNPLVASSEAEESTAPMGLASVAAVMREHAVAGHVVFLNFWLDADGARLVSARGAQGRAPATWTPGLRRGVLVYELRDRSGAVIAEGEVEDPQNRRLEYESQGGGISSTWVSLDSAALMLRLPGLPSPASLELYRGAPEDPARRVSIGRIQLQ